MSKRQSRFRRSLARLRRNRTPVQDRARERSAGAWAVRPRAEPEPSPSTALVQRSDAVGWDLDAAEPAEPAPPHISSDAPLTAQVLSLLSDPRIGSVTASSAAKLLGSPTHDVRTALEAMAQAGELVRSRGPTPRYGVSPERKMQLEAMFRDAAQELGEGNALARTSYQDNALAQIEDDEEPRLPVTAGLLSLFLPGTGQLLNGDVGRASLVFAVWSLALLTHLSPIWTFVALYAGAEAFFTAKIRSMERKLTLESANPNTGESGPPPALKPSNS
jgi:hypothetical protein